ncbi:MAG: 7-cyano-7-deazaguanine synthase QueC [Planctomycetes bacterium]|nr:7-cyano-7-deazaguanine synthase QueC [Planctomycetota bacterium]
MADDTPSTHPDTPRAVVLLSGGLDSATTLAIARGEGFECHAMSFDYGQRHRVELDAARRVAESLGVASHRWVSIDLRAFGGSALTDRIDVPKDRDESAMTHGIPVTYVPARNTIFLAYALALAEVIGSGDIFIGVNAVDYSGYPDCRPEYVAAFERTANLATRAGVEGKRLRIHTPLIQWPKTRIIETGLRLGVDFALTHSCYDPQPAGKDVWRACGRCDSCLIRKQAFEQLGMRDPALTR